MTDPWHRTGSGRPLSKNQERRRWKHRCDLYARRYRNEHLHRHRSIGIVFVIDNRSVVRSRGRFVVFEQVGVDLVAVMVGRIVIVEVCVHEQRRKRPER